METNKKHFLGGLCLELLVLAVTKKQINFWPVLVLFLNFLGGFHVLIATGGTDSSRGAMLDSCGSGRREGALVT